MYTNPIAPPSRTPCRRDETISLGSVSGHRTADCESAAPWPHSMSRAQMHSRLEHCSSTLIVTISVQSNSPRPVRRTYRLFDCSDVRRLQASRKELGL